AGVPHPPNGYPVRQLYQQAVGQESSGRAVRRTAQRVTIVNRQVYAVHGVGLVSGGKEKVQIVPQVVFEIERVIIIVSIQGVITLDKLRVENAERLVADQRDGRVGISKAKVVERRRAVKVDPRTV